MTSYGGSFPLLSTGTVHTRYPYILVPVDYGIDTMKEQRRSCRFRTVPFDEEHELLHSGRLPPSPLSGACRY